MRVTGRWIGRLSEFRWDPRILPHDPELDMLGHHLFRRGDVVVGSEHEQGGVFSHVFVLLLGNDELLPTARISTFAQDRHPMWLDWANHLVDAPAICLLLTDSTFVLVEHRILPNVPRPVNAVRTKTRDQAELRELRLVDVCRQAAGADSGEPLPVDS